VWFHLKIRFTFTFKRASSRLLKPFLQAIHTKAVFTSIALKWIDKKSVANSANELLAKHFWIFNSLSIHDIDFGLLGSSRGQTIFIAQVFGD
jgi:hypothetical protein